MCRLAVCLPLLVFIALPGCAPRPRDAKSTAAKNAMTFAAFLAQRPAEPTAVLASVRFQRPQGEEFRADFKSAAGDPWAYASETVDRRTDAGARLYEALKDGADHTVVLELRAAGGDRFDVTRVVEVLK